MPRSFPGMRTYSRSTSLSGRASPRATDPKTDNSAMPYFWHRSASRSPSALISSRVTRVAPSADLRNILRRTQTSPVSVFIRCVADGQGADGGRQTGAELGWLEYLDLGAQREERA